MAGWEDFSHVMRRVGGAGEGELGWNRCKSQEWERRVAFAVKDSDQSIQIPNCPPQSRALYTDGRNEEYETISRGIIARPSVADQVTSGLSGSWRAFNGAVCNAS